MDVCGLRTLESRRELFGNLGTQESTRARESYQTIECVIFNTRSEYPQIFWGRLQYIQSWESPHRIFYGGQNKLQKSCVFLLSPGQTESQVIASWKLALTCDSVSPRLPWTCDDLRPIWSSSNFHRLVAQRKSTQVGFTIVFLCTGARAKLHWNGFFAACVELVSRSDVRISSQGTRRGKGALSRTSIPSL